MNNKRKMKNKIKMGMIKKKKEEGRDQEDRGSKSAWANSSRDSISKLRNSKKEPTERLKWQNTHLASMRLSVQTPMTKKKTKKTSKDREFQI
jgi:hypothetical protein